MINAQPQQKYQVRFDVGLAGFQALAEAADVVVLADALPAAPGADGLTVPLAQTVITANLASSGQVADWVLARQAEKGDRFAVAVIAVGERRADGGARFAVEDFLVAGAVIDALSVLGIDHCSPEAAAAAASFSGLKRAVRHLVTASETAQALAATGRQAEVRAALAPDLAATDAGAVQPGISRVREFAFPA
ncbi:MAG: 2-phosphosulfolactate phosphatase [Ramlibacter sp.]|nr:2-phosphosulfolactate phosphatase [Cryobacterium sp.]